MSKDIVVMIDMQKDFIDGSLGSPAAQAIVPKVVEYLNNLSADVPVFATLDTHHDDYLDTLEGKMLPVKHCIKDTNGWELHPDVRKALEAHREKRGPVSNVGDKNVFQVLKATFGSCDLPGEIEWAVIGDHDAKEFVLHVLGLCSDICVSVNALLLRTFFKDSRIICHADLCAGTSEEAHKAALTVMKSCQIEIEE